MKNAFNKICAGALTIALGASMMFSMASCKKNKSYTANNTVFKIGAMGPEDGGAAKYGIAVRNSALMAVEEINALEDGEFKFELTFLNDSHDATKVASNYANLFENGMQVSIGCVTTSPALEFAPLSYDDSVFFITPSASGDAVPQYPNGYQMCFSDSNQGTASAQYFNANYQGKTVGVFYKSDDPYSSGIYENFKENLDSSFSLVEASFTGNPASFDSQVTLLSGCDVIFMPVYTEPASLFMKNGVGHIKNNAVYYGCDGLDGIDCVENFDINSIPQEVSFLSHFNSNATSGPAYDYIQKYNARFDEAKEPTNQFGAAAYDCVYAIYEAMKYAKAHGKELSVTMSAAELCELLQEVFNSEDFVFHGVTGECVNGQKSNISWDESGYVNKQAVKYVVKEADSN